MPEKRVESSLEEVNRILEKKDSDDPRGLTYPGVYPFPPVAGGLTEWGGGWCVG